RDLSDSRHDEATVRRARDRARDHSGETELMADAATPQASALEQPRFWTLDRVATDTRSVGAGDCFVALKGEKFDAHAFLADAVAKGAGAVVVHDAERARNLGVPVYVVDDTTRALGRLA